MRSAVVTGAAGGIGSAIASRLADDGWRLVLVDLVPPATVEDQGAGAQWISADLTRTAGVEAVRAKAEAVGGLELVVNNAGITRDARLVNLTEDQMMTVLDVNLGAPLQLVDALAPLMEAGSIVNVSSRAYLGNFGQFNYSMSKGGLVGLTRALALELAPRLRANAIAPGLIGTDMSMAIPAEVREKMVAAIPLGRMGEPAEVADLVAFLADATYITGEVIVVGGGRSLSR